MGTCYIAMGKSIMETRILAETVKANALRIFIASITPSIHIIKFSRGVNTFEGAAIQALERTFLNDSRFWNKKTDKTEKYNKNNIKCNRCERITQTSVAQITGV